MKPKYQAIFTSVNLLLGVGPLILPMPFFKAGIALSTLWMIAVSVLSYNSAMFISESIGKVRKMANDKNNQQASITFTDSLLTDSPDHGFKPTQEMIQQEKTKIDHTDQFRILFGPRWALIPSLTISIYLMGTSISKCIMTGKIMAQVFHIGDHQNNQNISVLANFNFWILVFFVCGSAFSFRSIDKTKVMQMLIIGVRMISILLFLGGAIYLVIKNGPRYSQIVYSLSCFTTVSQTQYELQRVHNSKSSYSGIVLIVIPLTGVMAFGDELIDAASPHSLIYYNFDFKNRIDFIYWFTSFYVFLNVAAFSVYIIVIRVNILHVLTPKIDSNKLCKQTVIASIFILSLILVLSWQLQDQIQIVLDFTGGILGILILFIIPALEIYKARKLSPIGNHQKYQMILPAFILSLGLVFLVFNLAQIVGQINS